MERKRRIALFHMIDRKRDFYVDDPPHGSPEKWFALFLSIKERAQIDYIEVVEVVELLEECNDNWRKLPMGRTRTTKLTFVWQDLNGHTVNVKQWQTVRRLQTEAWEDAFKDIVEKNPDANPAFLLAFKGWIEPFKENKPLRAPTKAEVSESLKREAEG